MSRPYPELEVASSDELREWLDANCQTSAGVWLVTGKKGRRNYISYDDIVDAALCFGWIDSQPRKVDADHSARLLTPRRPGSNWSRVNKQRVERLVQEGRMRETGLSVVAAAKTDGSWTALDAVEDLVEPPELTAALDADADARRHWDAFPRSTKRAILEWIGSAKTAPTRTKRIATTAAEAKVNRRANQWRQPS